MTKKELSKESKILKTELTNHAFWKFAAAYEGRNGVDLYDFQKELRRTLYPNRQTPHNEETKKLQNTQNKQIDRIIKAIPKAYPMVEIVTEQKFTSNKKFRPFIRLKTYNFQNALERKSHSEFLNSDLVKMSGLSTSDLLRNIKANINLIEKYDLQDIREKSNGITPNFSEKNIQKWKDGVVRIPAPLLLLVMCAVHKWIEANAMKLNRGRPRKLEGFDNQKLAAFVVGSSELLGLGNYPVFNTQIITQVYLIFQWWNEIDVALDNGLDEDETAKAIWTLYGKEISYNPMIQHENYFDIKHVREEVSRKFQMKEMLNQVRESIGLDEHASDLEVTNKLLAMTKQMGVTANNEASIKNRKAMYGELINCYFDYTSEVLKLYNAIYEEFTFIDSKLAYNDHMKKDVVKKDDDKKDVVIQENEEHKFENPEDYFGI